MDRPTPRVYGASLPKFVGQNVRAVAEVTGVRDGVASIVLADGTETHIVMDEPTTQFPRFVEFIATVLEDCSLHELTAMPLGDNFDMPNYFQALKISMKFPDIFPIV
eukprot:Opistho-2@60674